MFLQCSCRSGRLRPCTARRSTSATACHNGRDASLRFDARARNAWSCCRCGRCWNGATALSARSCNRCAARSVGAGRRPCISWPGITGPFATGRSRIGVSSLCRCRRLRLRRRRGRRRAARRRGVEARTWRNKLNTEVYPPHVRGWTGDGAHKVALAVVFPACAGLDRSRFTGGIAWPSIPRVRAVKLSSCACDALVARYPRVRGNVTCPWPRAWRPVPLVDRGLAESRSRG